MYEIFYSTHKFAKQFFTFPLQEVQKLIHMMWEFVLIKKVKKAAIVINRSLISKKRVLLKITFFLHLTSVTKFSIHKVESFLKWKFVKFVCKIKCSKILCIEIVAVAV